jgi:hypothetical protein
MTDAVGLSINTLKRGDYFLKSEFDTKDKYNIASKVFKLFGFVNLWSYEDMASNSERYNLLVVDDEGEVDGCNNKCFGCERRITFDQLITIGKLKCIEEMSLIEDLLKDLEIVPQKDF